MNIGEQVILRLNTSALNALFPEGTDARVQLQSAVLAEASSKFIKGQLTDDITAVLKGRCDEVAKSINVDSIMAVLFERKNWNRLLEVKEGSELHVAIKANIEKAFKDHVETSMIEQIEQRLTEWKEQMEPSIIAAVDYKVQSITRSMLTAKVNEAFSAVGLAPVK